MASQDETKSHTWEVSLSVITSSPISILTLAARLQMLPFELSLLTGMTVHPRSSFTTVPLTSSVRMEWSQEYMISWKHWVKKVISDEDAEQCFKAMPNISDRRVQQLMHQFRIECQTHGRTIWAMYSAATYYATSNQGQFTVRETGLDHSASTLMNREQQVRAWLNQDEFNKIAA